MHPTCDGSDLSAMRSLGAGTLAIDAWTWRVLRVAAELYAESGGLFDPCTSDRDGRMRDIRLLDLQRVEIARPVAIDLGGIAKGFAVDCAIDALRDLGCSAGEVNAGGDVRVFGRVETDVWIRAGDFQWPIRLSDAACAVSDASATDRPREHRAYYRRIATPSSTMERIPWAAVIAPSAMLADALTTYAVACCSAEEREQFRRVVARHDGREPMPPGVSNKKSPAAEPG
jgi:thiamine biosynthesis lipoprotein